MAVAHNQETFTCDSCGAEQVVNEFRDAAVFGYRRLTIQPHDGTRGGAKVAKDLCSDCLSRVYRAMEPPHGVVGD